MTTYNATDDMAQIAPLEMFGKHTASIIGIASVSVLSPTSIRVTFDMPARNNEALQLPGNYVIIPTLAVYTVVPEAVAEPNYVDLEIDEQKTGQPYTVEAQIIEKA